MPGKPFRILSTKVLSSDARKPAQREDVQLDMLDFIKLDSVPPLEGIPMFRYGAVPENGWVVFTSAIAPRTIDAYRQGFSPIWRIACLEGATREATYLLTSRSTIEITAPDAATLADKIIAHGNIEEVYFFCGDQRKDTIPQRLRAAGITVHERVIYHNTATPHTIHHVYDAILFFSPTAVKSFFSVNTLPPQTICFAIGNTTGAALTGHTTNKIITAVTPAAATLLQTAIDHLEHLYNSKA